MSPRAKKASRLAALPASPITIPPLSAYVAEGQAFILSELQAVVAEVSAAPVHKASFRRILIGLGAVQPTKAWRVEGRGRPARVYTWAKMTQAQHDLVAYRLAQWAFDRRAAA